MGQISAHQRALEKQLEAVDADLSVAREAVSVLEQKRALLFEVMETAKTLQGGPPITRKAGDTGDEA